MKYFKKIIIFWQTILFCIVIFGMIAFIYSALRPNQYSAESKFLIIPSTNKNTCVINLGKTFSEIILSESFYNALIKKDKFYLTFLPKNKYSLKNNSKIKIKSYKNTSIVKITVYDNSLHNVQKILTDIEDITKEQFFQYYPLQNTLKIKLLSKSKVIRAPRIILENTFYGLIIGFIISLIMIETIKLDLKLVPTSNRKKYNTIIKQKLKRELLTKNQNNLFFNDDYTFEKNLQKLSKKGKLLITKNNSLLKKESQKTEISEKDRMKTVPVRVIASNMMLKMENKVAPPPENLPVFIDYCEKKSKKITSPSKKNGISPGDKSNKKRPSAHDIANGFAPDRNNLNNPSNEEIKDRLNKLLRGEL